MNKFAKFAWFVLIYNLPVIVWGAYVRIAKAGAGCGEHWPDCNGQLIPLAPSTNTLIEFSHRLSTGLDGIFILVLAIWSFIAFPKKHIVRWMASLSLLFTIFEALIGAVLVKKGLVADNDSVARAVVIGGHLVNTLLLLGFLTLTAWWATNTHTTGWPLRLMGNLKSALMVGFCLLSVIFLSASGAISALGATLFPVQSIAEGLTRDLSPRHFLEGLIWIHPLSAVLLGLTMIFVVSLLGFAHKAERVLALTKMLIGLITLQLLFGGVNVLLHAPVWLQLTHLLVADIVWILLVIFSATLLAVDANQVQQLKTGHKEVVAATS